MRITDHRALALADLTSAFRNTANVRSLLRVLADRVQVVENVASDVVLKKLLQWPGATSIGPDVVQDAEGASLDILAALLGVARAGRSDANLRLALRMEIRVRRSRGRKRDLQEIALLTSTSPAVTYTEPAPATALISIAPVPTDGSSVFRAFDRAKALGTRLLLAVGDTADGLEWAHTSGPVAANQQLVHTSGTPTNPFAHGVSL